MTTPRSFAEEYMVMVAVRNRFIDILTEAFGGHYETFGGKPEAQVIRETVDRLLAVDPEKLNPVGGES